MLLPDPFQPYVDSFLEWKEAITISPVIVGLMNWIKTYLLVNLGTIKILRERIAALLDL